MTGEASDESSSDETSRVTVLLAGAANLAIGVAKLAAGLASGSAAMLAEAAHSFADTLNQVFLLTALQRATRRPTGRIRSATAWSATSGPSWQQSASSCSAGASRSTKASRCSSAGGTTPAHRSGPTSC